MAFRTHVLVCAGTGCVSGNSYATATALESEIFKKGLAQEVQVIRTGCQGFCAEGPIVIVQPDGVFTAASKLKTRLFWLRSTSSKEGRSRSSCTRLRKRRLQFQL
jgi:hypothetical protein